MTTRPAKVQQPVHRTPARSVVKVERAKGRFVARLVEPGRSSEVKVTVKVAASGRKRRRDLFESTTLPATLEKSFRAAVEAARRRYA